MAGKSREIDGRLNVDDVCLNLHEAAGKLWLSARRKGPKRNRREIYKRAANIFIGGLIAASALNIKDIEKIILERAKELKTQE